MDARELAPQQRLMPYVISAWITRPLQVATELGIADLLADGALTVDELARQTATHAPSLYRVLRALATVGIFAELADKEFIQTPMSECLREGALRSTVLLHLSECFSSAWSQLLQSVKTGQPAFESARGAPLYDWLEREPQARQIFNEANAARAKISGALVPRLYNLSQVSTMTDVGGGQGAFMVEILQAEPAIRGIVFERPSVAAAAREVIEESGLSHRCEVLSGDFFERVPPGSEAYVLANVLHNWPDSKCQVLLENLVEAMAPSSLLLILEAIIPETKSFSITKLLDLEVFVLCGGRERTLQELRALLEGAGLRISRVISLGEESSLIETTRRTDG